MCGNRGKGTGHMQNFFWSYLLYSPSQTTCRKSLASWVLACPWSLLTQGLGWGTRDTSYRRFCYSYLNVLTQSFLKITSYNIQYLHAFVLSWRIHDFMLFVLTSSAPSSLTAYYWILTVICPFWMFGPYFHPCSSFLQVFWWEKVRLGQ